MVSRYNWAHLVISSTIGWRAIVTFLRAIWPKNPISQAVIWEIGSSDFCTTFYTVTTHYGDSCIKLLKNSDKSLKRYEKKKKPKITKICESQRVNLVDTLTRYIDTLCSPYVVWGYHLFKKLTNSIESIKRYNPLKSQKIKKSRTEMKSLITIDIETVASVYASTHIGGV
jgi:hypothetical protein